MKIKYRRKRRTLEEKVRIATDYNAAMPIQEILERYHINKNQLYNILSEVVEK